MMRKQEKEKVFFDIQTSLYGIGTKNGLTYEPEFTKAQAIFVLRQHNKGVETFEEILRIAAAQNFDMAVTQ